MPSYTFSCKEESCTMKGMEIDVVKRMTDPNPECDSCSVEMSQVFKSPPKFTLKGSDWTHSKHTGGKR